MALAPKDRYPGQTIAGDPDYPQGKARDVAVPGDGTGTPLQADWLNDLWGFLQALLGAGGITPSGTPDHANASQYRDALDRRLRLGQHWSLTRQATAETAGSGNLLDIGIDRDPDEPVLIACGLNTSLIRSLAAGDFWTDISANLAAITTPRSIVHDGASRWVVVGDTGGSAAIETSDDSGATWTSRASALAGTLTRVRHDGAGLYVAIDNAGGIQSSPDGVTWTSRANPTVEVLLDVHYGNGKWVAVAENGAVITSPDGATWTDRTARSAGAAGDHLYAVTYDAVNGAWIAGGEGGFVQTTSDPDTVDWTDATALVKLTASDRVRAITTDGSGVAYLVGGDAVPAGCVAVSYDGGATWILRRVDSALHRAAIWTGDRWVITGLLSSDALVLTSTRFATATAAGAGP